MYKIGHFISMQGICSRRSAEKLIKAGRVKINNITCKVAMRCSENDNITIDDQIIKKQNTIVCILNKPPMYLVSHRPEKMKKTIFDLTNLDQSFRYAGRLDFLSQGLIILSNNPEVVHKLTTGNIRRVYKVSVNSVDKNFTKFLNKPIIDGVELKKIDLINIKQIKNSFIIKLALYEGKNREIRKIMSKFNMKINFLERTEYGAFKCMIPLGEMCKVANWAEMLKLSIDR